MNTIIRTLLASLLLGICGSALVHAQQQKGLENILVQGDEWQVAVDGLGFADGLSCDQEGTLFFADLRGKNQGVYKLSVDGTKSKVADGGRSGTKFGPDGRLYAVGGTKLVAFDLSSGKESLIKDGLGTNDLAVSSRGHVYITDTGKHQVTLVDNRTGEAKPADVGIGKPNGIALSPDQTTLYVSDYGGMNVWSFKVQQDGTLTDKKAALTMKAPEKNPTVAGGDGMAVDQSGRCYVTTALGIQVFSTDGALLGILPKPGNGALVSVGFAGKDHSTLFAACGDKIYKRKVQVSGARPLIRGGK